MTSGQYENGLADLSKLDLHVRSAQSVTWQGRSALQLDGLVLIPGLRLADVRIHVLVGADGPCYPGIAFRAADSLNYELAYVVPHVSGQWDAVQYDPVFHGSNTWQIYHGAPYQKAVEVPTGRWFSLTLHVQGQRASVYVEGQQPLRVERLAHQRRVGWLGLWTYKPAYFANLTVNAAESLAQGCGEPPTAPHGAARAWFLEGYGTVQCEPNGNLNLKRYLPAGLGEARLSRSFEMLSEGQAELAFGFSDELSLYLDDELVFAGENKFAGFGGRAERGYVEPEAHLVRRRLGHGVHRLRATLKDVEGFGWGLCVSLRGASVRWLPAGLSS